MIPFRIGVPVSLVVALCAAYLNSSEHGDLLSVYAAPFLGAFMGTYAVVWIWAADIQRAASRFLPSTTAMFALGLWLYLILGPLPSLSDQSFLLAREGIGSLGPAYLYAGFALFAYAAGTRLVRLPEKIEPPGPTYSAGLALLILLAFCWGTRAALARGGNLSAYHSGEAESLDGLSQYAFYGTLYLRWAIIPLTEFQRSRLRWKGRLVCLLICASEIVLEVLAIDRTRLILVAVEWLLCRAYFASWRPRHMAAALSALAVVFVLVVNPFVYAVRAALGSDGFSANQLVSNAALSVDVLLRGATARQNFAGLEERDAKYRINGTYWIAGMIGADNLGTSHHGLGSFTVRELGTLVPSFLWPEKGEYVLRNAKFEISHEVGVTPTDYMQTLPGFWYADFAWFGIVAMFFAGIFDQAVTRALLQRLSSPFAFALTLLFCTVNLAPTEDFSGHFLLRFRESLPFFGALVLFERWLRSARPSTTYSCRSERTAAPSRSWS